MGLADLSCSHKALAGVKLTLILVPLPTSMRWDPKNAAIPSSRSSFRDSPRPDCARSDTTDGGERKAVHIGQTNNGPSAPSIIPTVRRPRVVGAEGSKPNPAYPSRFAAQIVLGGFGPGSSAMSA